MVRQLENNHRALNKKKKKQKSLGMRVVHHFTQIAEVYVHMRAFSTAKQQIRPKKLN